EACAVGGEGEGPPLGGAWPGVCGAASAHNKMTCDLWLTLHRVWSPNPQLASSAPAGIWPYGSQQQTRQGPAELDQRAGSTRSLARRISPMSCRRVPHHEHA